MVQDPETYEFEMFELRRAVLRLVAKKSRQNSPRIAKRTGKLLIKRRAEGDAEAAAEAFTTSFERALTMIEDGGAYDIKIEELPPILADHDAEIDPNTEIEGETVSVIRSVDRTESPTEERTYPVVEHAESEYRICTCPAQKFYIVCPHTLARVIERNLPEQPAAAEEVTNA